MAFLSGAEIEDLVQSGHVHIDPFDSRLLKPASYVLRLGDGWRGQSGPGPVVELESASDVVGPLQTAPEMVLDPGGFCLGCTAESLAIPRDHVGLVVPLSHVARAGISVGLGSLLVSPGFGDSEPTRLTLEIVSHTTRGTRLRAGTPICHLLLAPVPSDRSDRLLGHSVYSGRPSPVPSNLYEEFSFLGEHDEEGSCT